MMGMAAATEREMRGRNAYLSGYSAEEAVAADYARRGHDLAARRWRGSRGELDLVLQDGDGLIIVEVKKARDFARAAARLSRAQLARIYNTTAEFLAGTPNGQLTDLRFDLALVDAAGQIEIRENCWA
jgi:putative endonuclease